MRPLATLFFLLSCTFFSLAQDSYLQGGLFFGVSHYSGDINPTVTPDFSEVGLALGVLGHIYATPTLGVRGSMTYARLRGSDQKYEVQDARNFSFQTNLIELAGVVEWEPLAPNRFYADQQGGEAIDRLISPYVLAGVSVGIAQLNPDFSGYRGGSPFVLAGILEDESQGNSKAVFSIPIGAGVKFDLSKKLTLAGEITGRLVLSDYLDGIAAAAGDRNDGFFTSGLILYYRFLDGE